MKLKSIQNKAKIIVILGPTATGKSELAVKIAEKHNGEIISADSRQVYRGLNIGTGKITKKEMSSVPHHMLDVVSPKKVFTVAEWKDKTEKIIEDILSRGKLPIICGGTGFYIKSIVDDVVLPEVPPNMSLRKKLEKKNLLQLISILKKLYPKRLQTIDTKNPVRLIRAIEIATKLGSVPEIKNQKPKYQFLQIGLNLEEKILKSKIHKRVLSRMKKGMIKEVRDLHKNGLSWKRIRELGLEYRYIADYIDKKQPLKASSGRMTITKMDLLQKLDSEIWHYAKRQMTWFKKDKKIKWFEPSQDKKIDKEIRKFLA